MARMTLLYSVQAREGQANSSSGERLSCPGDRRDTRLRCVARPGVAKAAGCAVVPEYTHEERVHSQSHLPHRFQQNMTSPGAWAVATEHPAHPGVRKDSRGLPGDNLPKLRATARVPAPQARSREQTNATVLAPGPGRADLSNPHALRCPSPAAGAAATCCHDNQAWQPSLCLPGGDSPQN